MKKQRSILIMSILITLAMVTSPILSVIAIPHSERLPAGQGQADAPGNESKFDLTLIDGPPAPPPEYEAEIAASITPPTRTSRGMIANFPSYSWVFGCSAVSGAMIAGYYDRNGFPDMYTGPTNSGVMPLTDTSWSTWTDINSDTYPNNPLVASKNGVDGRTSRGSIDNYWVQYNSSAADPFITYGWPEHTWSTAIGDFMKTSQSTYHGSDGSTWFFNYGNNSQLTCNAMESAYYGDWSMFINEVDGTYGRKEFYEARGYTVTDCYNQKTDNKYTGGFSLNDFKAEIDAGHPVLINLEGHSMVGYGYIDGTNTIYIRDTWDNDPSTHYTMTWGGSYSGMVLDSVSIVHFTNSASPPSAPTGVSATYDTYYSRIQVSWTASAGATSYQVYRHTSDNSAGASQLPGSPTSSPFDDTSATPGMDYYYWVKACNSGGCSGFSSSALGRRSALPIKSFYLPLFLYGPAPSLTNGDFEAGQDGSWTEFSSNGWDLISHEAHTPVSAESGEWLVWLGGGNDETSRLSQSFKIPFLTPYLHFWYYIASEDGCGFDYARVKVNDHPPVKEYDLCTVNVTPNWVHEVVDLSGYAGSTVNLMFEVTTDSSMNSSFFLDTVSLSSSP